MLLGVVVGAATGKALAAGAGSTLGATGTTCAGTSFTTGTLYSGAGTVVPTPVSFRMLRTGSMGCGTPLERWQ